MITTKRRASKHNKNNLSAQTMNLHSTNSNNNNKNGNHGKQAGNAMTMIMKLKLSVCKHNLCTPFMYLSSQCKQLYLGVFVRISTCLHTDASKIQTLKFFILYVGNFSDHEPKERIKFSAGFLFLLSLLTCVVAFFILDFFYVLNLMILTKWTKKYFTTSLFLSPSFFVKWKDTYYIKCIELVGT